jgi:hypothetical protein
MWISIRTVLACIVGRAARSLIAASIGLCAAFAATPSQAQPDDYVRVCSIYGAAFFYIPPFENPPSANTCVNASQIVNNQYAIARSVTRAATGTAMAASLVNPFLPDGTNFAVSAHWAGFDGQHAVGFAGMMRLKGNLAFTAGLAVGLDRGKLVSLTERTQTEFGTSHPAESWSELRVLGRAGLTYSW